jgi:IclR family mhp operon transcriptional activator
MDTLDPLRLAEKGRVSRVETIKGLERGLRVLQVLQAKPIASLAELHAATAISKPSLLRILKTLQRAGLVSQRMADGQYRLSTFSGVVRRRDRHDRVAEAAAPVLERLCEKVNWPSDLFVPVGDCMELRETSRPRSPFVLFFSSKLVGVHVGWLMTGVGRAYLAWCPEREREDILSRLRKSDLPEDRLAREPKRLQAILSETRSRGYGTRDPAYLSGRYGSYPRGDGMATIAVPLLDGRRVHGSINILWIRTSHTVEDFAARHLADLQDAAREIVASLQRPTNRRRG